MIDEPTQRLDEGAMRALVPRVLAGPLAGELFSSRTRRRAVARISIEPAWARFFDFGAGRMQSFLTKLAGNA